MSNLLNNPVLPSATPTTPNLQIPQITPPFMPTPQDTDAALKLYQWFNGSGLTYEQIDALAKHKKDGKDIDQMLGIEKPKSDIEKLSEAMAQYMKNTDDKIGQLATAIEKLVMQKQGPASTSTKPQEVAQA